MTYIVKDECIKCKLTDCVEVCPVDCFYEGENMLVINPDECIDCGVCEPECPIDAIKPDTDDGIIDKEKLYEKMKKGISLKNVLISCISQIRFSLKFICISMLPLSISIPITIYIYI